MGLVLAGGARLRRKILDFRGLGSTRVPAGSPGLAVPAAVACFFWLNLRTKVQSGASAFGWFLTARFSLGFQ